MPLKGSHSSQRCRSCDTRVSVSNMRRHHGGKACRQRASERRKRMSLDVVFKIANSYATLRVVNVIDLPVARPATAGIGVLAEQPEDPPDNRSKRPWRGDLVAWWRSCDESEPQAFELGVNGASVHGITHGGADLAQWLDANRTQIEGEIRRFNRIVSEKLMRHVDQQLAEAERLECEANGVKAKKSEALAAVGVKLPRTKKAAEKKSAEGSVRSVHFGQGKTKRCGARSGQWTTTESSVTCLDCLRADGWPASARVEGMLSTAASYVSNAIEDIKTLRRWNNERGQKTRSADAVLAERCADLAMELAEHMQEMRGGAK